MSRNGTGGYNLPVNSWNPAVNGVAATATDWQSLINDVASAIQQSVSSDGQTAMTGPLNMGGNKLTSVANGSNSGDAVNYGQLITYASLSQLSASSGSSLIGYLPSGTSAVATTVQAKFRENKSVKDFGAVGDGVSDDTAEIQAANDDVTVLSLHFPPGTYKATTLTMTKPWTMDEGAEIVFAGSVGQVLVSATGSNLSGNLNLSGGGVAPRSLMAVSGTGCKFGRIRLRNVNAAVGTGTVTGYEDNGAGNSVEQLIVTAFANTGNVNDSMPQSFCANSGAVGSVLNDLYINGGQSGVVANITGGTLTVGNALMRGMVDNGVYVISGNADIGTVDYGGTDEPVVILGTASIGNLIVNSAGNSAIGIQSCGDVKIGTLMFKNTSVSSIIRTRSGSTACGNVLIGSVIGEFTGSTLLSCTVGTIENLSILNMDVEYYYDAAIGPSFTSWAVFDSCKGFNFRNWNIKVIDKNNALGAGSFFTLIAPIANLTRQSYFYNVDVIVVNADKVTVSTNGEYRGAALAQSLIQTSGLRWQMNVGPYAKQVSYGEPNTAPAAPTIGTWRAGQRFQRNLPVVGQPKAWSCTVAGTPGTWVSEGNL